MEDTKTKVLERLKTVSQTFLKISTSDYELMCNMLKIVSNAQYMIDSAILLTLNSCQLPE